MTITTDSSKIYDGEGFEVTPGTLCWVRTDSTVPSAVRNSSRCLAVYAGAGHAQTWLLLIPTTDDPWVTASDRGWNLRHHLSSHEMESLNVERFADSHRGWWPTSVEFVETCIGYWCVEHQVFHAAETCPPSDDPERAANLTRIAELEQMLTRARADVEQARIQGEQALEDFKIRCSDILGDAANDHDLCGAYDAVCEEAGLYPRPQNHEIEIEVAYSQTITVRARTYDAAREIVEELSASSYFEPPTPFSNDSEIEEHGSPYSLSISVA